ncbi:MAG: response regulator [Rhodospirillales bacterium]|jgi:two-component system, NtrC family, response regulator AtoC|nr:response regulator [Rhodospirillales bacterium]
MLDPSDPGWEPSSIADIATMVVDDDPMITKIVEAALLNMGMTNVYAINDPRQAMDFLAEGIGGVQLIICDLQMPDVSGIDVLEQVRLDFPDLPFLMLTANRSPDAVSKAVGKGVSSYMVKPFQLGELQDRVWQLINRRYRGLGKESNLPGSLNSV